MVNFLFVIRINNFSVRFKFKSNNSLKFVLNSTVSSNKSLRISVWGYLILHSISCVLFFPLKTVNYPKFFSQANI